MFEKTLAALGLLACSVLLLGMALGPRRVARLRQTWLHGWRWRERHQARHAARTQAEQAIQRARQGTPPRVQREGNVLRPDTFKRPPEDRIH